MQTELLRRLNDSGKEIEASPVPPVALADLLKLVESGQITGRCDVVDERYVPLYPMVVVLSAKTSPPPHW